MKCGGLISYMTKISFDKQGTLMNYSRISENLTKYFVDIPAYCPYGQPYTAVYSQSIFGPLPDALFEFFLESGFRRNGNTIYTMKCQGCDECVPIRLDTSNFTLNRSQRRALKMNEDIDVKIGPPEMTDDKLAVLQKFLEERYPGKFNSAEEYYTGFFINTITSTIEVRFMLGEEMVGAGIVDTGSNYLSAVYFYFDPQFSKRSPGTFNILYLANLCRQLKMQYLYLGYWIRDVAAMSYKSKFLPHELLRNDRWIEVGR